MIKSLVALVFMTLLTQAASADTSIQCLAKKTVTAIGPIGPLLVSETRSEFSVPLKNQKILVEERIFEGALVSVRSGPVAEGSQEGVRVSLTDIESKSFSSASAPLKAESVELFKTEFSQPGMSEKESSRETQVSLICTWNS